MPGMPSPASPFRTLEYGHYLNFFPSSVLVSMEAWHFGFAHAGLGDLDRAFEWQARAFAQHTVNSMRSAGCDIDESALEGVTE